MKTMTICSLTIAALALTPLAASAGDHGHGHHHKDRGHHHKERGHHYSRDRVIVVKEGYRHRGPAPRHRYYQRDNLAKIATFAVLAGVTYAIVDNVYYKQRGDRYEYVAQPPAGSYRVLEGR